jgi:hypothetical protein
MTHIRELTWCMYDTSIDYMVDISKLFICTISSLCLQDDLMLLLSQSSNDMYRQ